MFRVLLKINKIIDKVIGEIVDMAKVSGSGNILHYFVPLVQSSIYVQTLSYYSKVFHLTFSGIIFLIFVHVLKKVILLFLKFQIKFISIRCIEYKL